LGTRPAAAKAEIFLGGEAVRLEVLPSPVCDDGRGFVMMARGFVMMVAMSGAFAVCDDGGERCFPACDDGRDERGSWMANLRSFASRFVASVGVLDCGCGLGPSASFPKEERFENKPTGKGATLSRTALGWL